MTAQKHGAQTAPGHQQRPYIPKQLLLNYDTFLGVSSITLLKQHSNACAKHNGPLLSSICITASYQQLRA